MPGVDTSALHRAFLPAFGTRPRGFRSPGRINLIGEHTDCNDGYVLPAAIAPGAYLALSPRDDARRLALGGDLTRVDLAPAGRQQFDTHAGLRDIYEVSCPEAGLPVEQTPAWPGLSGGRRMSGGLGDAP